MKYIIIAKFNAVIKIGLLLYCISSQKMQKMVFRWRLLFIVTLIYDQILNVNCNYVQIEHNLVNRRGERVLRAGFGDNWIL